MTKPFHFPTPNDRSANKPRIDVNKRKILSIYNRAHKFSAKQAKYLSKKVRQWFINQAKVLHKWDDAIFTGNQCQLTANLPVR